MNILQMRNEAHLEANGFALPDAVKLDQLVRGYHTHDCIIDYDEAALLGLPVKPC